ncbi:TM0106 family RecB-like putative nuclease [Ruania zhangjianzhongii]|uniref:TM0106 family RecB-like putative nuclease n=1 Tax=Ruania zhangjianzhongii TaxID=2603206 RepID=UPI0011CAF15F|nr:bifunctional RecB family nuclease/DEAD/DEAH box helicase [Ruania zhangjianzhongii]
MFLQDDTLVYSASDLTLARDCEFALLSKLDEKLGRRPRLRVENAMRDYSARLGDEHEAQVLADYRQRFGTGVVEIAVPEDYTAATLRAHAERTRRALRSGADVVFQGGFFDGRFHGRSDFLVRQVSAQGQVSYAVVDTKLARSVKPGAVLQLAAYADQLLAAGIEVAPETVLHLGDGTIATQDMAGSVAVYREHRAHVQAMLDAGRAADGPVVWGDDRYQACLWCDYCQEAVAANRDVKLVWGMRGSHRTALRAAGITTIEELADAPRPAPKVHPKMWRRLQAQAKLQLRQERAEAAGTQPQVFAEVHGLAALQAMPAPDPGDVFFDFEGDPLWVDSDRTVWGIEYLFGLLQADGEQEYVSFWAHDRAAEGQALRDFLDYLHRRREQFPDMHVYHYAAYETATLRRLAERHQVGVEEVEELIAAGVFIDLYATVKHSVRVSQRSYSIKKLEPLYMGSELRNADGVTSGGDSVLAYAQAQALRDAGDVAGFEARLAELAEYNRYDCLSTLRLRDWLITQREAALAEQGAAGPSGAGRDGAAAADQPPSAAFVAAMTGAEFQPSGDWSGQVEETPEQQERRRLAEALHRHVPEPLGPLLAAALEYHRQEDDPYWREHFDRLRSDRGVSDTRDVLEVFHTRRRTVANEYGRTRTLLDLAGRFGTGSTVEPGGQVFVVYDAPLPAGLTPPAGCDRAAIRAKVVSRDVSPTGLDRVTLSESVPPEAGELTADPVLVTPGPPPPARALVQAIELVARGELAAHGITDGDGERDAAGAGASAADGDPGASGGDPPNPTAPSAADREATGARVGAAALDIAAGIPPRLRGEQPLPPRAGTDADGTAGAVVSALTATDDSYLAVQGPPGTGKTYLGVQVIARLVQELGWRVGVVAQSHAVVEHVLHGLVDAGLPTEQIGKRARVPRTEDLAALGIVEAEEPPWVTLETYGHHGFLARHAEHGAVVGGTAWDFANRRRFDAGELDLLVIDEAGQFALANTFAVATAARRLLLLGDPQQLPQVSQGSHAAPVDESALGRLAHGHATLPSTHGYLLEQTRRLHPALCSPVSELYYDGQLHSHPVAAERHLDGLDAGLHVVTLDHTHRTVDSPEESAEAITQLESLLDRSWTNGQTRPLAPADVLVVAAYNAQVQRLRHDLAAAGLPEVRVGTVDKFQGQQAAVVLISLATSSAESTPRGLEFLLSPNRLNVAISRGQWAAILVRSRALTRYLPWEAGELRELGGFIELCRRAQPRRPRHH